MILYRLKFYEDALIKVFNRSAVEGAHGNEFKALEKLRLAASYLQKVRVILTDANTISHASIAAANETLSNLTEEDLMYLNSLGLFLCSNLLYRNLSVDDLIIEAKELSQKKHTKEFEKVFSSKEWFEKLREIALYCTSTEFTKELTSNYTPIETANDVAGEIHAEILRLIQQDQVPSLARLHLLRASHYLEETEILNRFYVIDEEEL